MIKDKIPSYILNIINIMDARSLLKNKSCNFKCKQLLLILAFVSDADLVKISEENENQNTEGKQLEFNL